MHFVTFFRSERIISFIIEEETTRLRATFIEISLISNLLLIYLLYRCVCVHVCLCTLSIQVTQHQVSQRCNSDGYVSLTLPSVCVCVCVWKEDRVFHARLTLPEVSTVTDNVRKMCVFVRACAHGSDKLHGADVNGHNNGGCPRRGAEDSRFRSARCLQQQMFTFTHTNRIIAI